MNMNHTLGEYIGEAIDQSALTRDQIAANIGVDPSYLSKVRTDAIIPSDDVLDALIAELGLDPDQARKLAEVAKNTKTILKLKRQALASLNSLRRNAPEDLREIIASFESSRHGASKLADEFWKGMLHFFQNPVQGAIGAPAGAGHPHVLKVLCISTQPLKEIALRIVDGPSLNQEGEVVVFIELEDRKDVDGLPEVWVDMFSMFQDEDKERIQRVASSRLTPEAVTPGAEVQLRGKLPETPELQKLLKWMRDESQQIVQLPSSAFSFRARFEEK